MEFSSPQASTATKHKIDSLTGGGGLTTRKYSVVFTNASQNPFKTLPKDAPARVKEDRSRSGSAPYVPQQNNYNSNAGFRGGRGGGFNNRGGYNNQGSYNNNNSNNRNFSGQMNNYNNGTYQGNMNNYGGFNRGGMMGNNMRGNMGGMRGGRGGGMGNPMMNMGPMGMNMGMNPMMAGMGMQGKAAAPKGSGKVVY